MAETWITCVVCGQYNCAFNYIFFLLQINWSRFHWKVCNLVHNRLHFLAFEINTAKLWIWNTQTKYDLLLLWIDLSRFIALQNVWMGQIGFTYITPSAQSFHEDGKIWSKTFLNIHLFVAKIMMIIRTF